MVQKKEIIQNYLQIILTANNSRLVPNEVDWIFIQATRDTIETTRRMSAVGADAVLVATPCFYKGGMTNNALIQHYKKVSQSLVLL